MVNSIREEALDWWKEALYNLKQAKKIFEIKKFTIARYPNAANAVPSEAYTEEIAKRCLEAAEKVINWVKNKTNLSESI